MEIDKLKDFVDPGSLLAALGFSVYYENNDEIRGPCAIHGGDNKTGFSFRKEHKRFYCYTHGCEIDESGEVNNDIISLVMKVNKCSFVEAVRFLGELTGFDVELGSIDEVKESSLRKGKDKDKFVKGIIGVDQLPELDEALVGEYCSNGSQYFLDKGFSELTIKAFELGTYIDEFGVERASIPIRDEYNRLVSISGRRTDGDGEPRYRLIRNFQKRRVLYNLYNVLDVKDLYFGNVIVVEGFKALWHVVASGFLNVVAVMGRSITSEQINLLVRYGFSCVTLLLDGDEKGRIGMKRSLDLLHGKINTNPIYLPDDVCPDDVCAKDLFDLISLFL
jgi:DNA primase